MSLGEVPMKGGGGAKQNASLEQGTQVSTATQIAATTTTQRHTENLSGVTYQPLYPPRPWAKGEGRGGANTNCMTSQSEYASSEAWQKPVSQKGSHDQQTPLTRIGLILN